MKLTIDKMQRRYGRVSFYAHGIFRDVLPYSLFEHRLKAAFDRLAAGARDNEDLFARARYYNHMRTGAELADAGRIDRLKLTQSYYYYDLKQHAKCFGRSRRLNHVFGDVTWVPAVPSIVKSRPIEGDIANSVVMKLDHFRHFRTVEDRVPFREKKPNLVWRGGLTNPNRKRFAESFGNHPRFDVGHTSGGEFSKPFMTNADQMSYRYIVSLEGVDVATNLKWIMASQSVPVMPRPKFETWFMEGSLKPDVHFIEIKPDYSDLEDKIAYYDAHLDEARTIVTNANAHSKQFTDKNREDLVSLLVLQKYFECTGQAEPTAFSHRLYD